MSSPEKPVEVSLFQSMEERGILTITLSPELSKSDWGNIESAGQEIQSLLEQKKHPKVILDLSRLEYMMSAMVALLLNIWKRVKAKEGQMVFVGPADDVYEVLKLAGLTNLWTICETREEAVLELGSTVEKTGRNLSPFLLISSLVAVLLAIGIYVIDQWNGPSESDSLLWSVQLAAGLFAFLLSVWSARASQGGVRVASFVLAFLAVLAIAAEYSGFPIPGLNAIEEKIEKSQDSSSSEDSDAKEDSSETEPDLKTGTDAQASADEPATNEASGESDPVEQADETPEAEKPTSAEKPEQP